MSSLFGKIQRILKELLLTTLESYREKISYILSFISYLHFPPIHHQSRRDENRGIGSKCDSDEKRQREVFDGRSAEDKNCEERDDDGERCID